MQEFFILRPYRDTGIADRVAVNVFERFRGRWEFKVLPMNQRALAFWRRVLDCYTRQRFTESAGTATSSAMRTFRFDNSRPPT
jgi:predicted acetyltransferase